MIKVFLLLFSLLITAAASSAENIIENKKEILTFGFSSVVIKENLKLNNRFVEYISKKTGIPAKVVYRKSYEEMNWMLKKKNADFAWTCSVPYIIGAETFGLDLVAIPLINNKPLYHSYVITQTNNKIKELDDFRGKRYAFSDPLSNSGKLVPTYILKTRLSETPETFFKEFIYTFSHLDSIKAVSTGFVDGASVDSYVYDTAKIVVPEAVNNTKIIEKFGPYGFPPIVARKGIGKETLDKVITALIEMENDPEGRSILKEFGFTGFITGNDKIYAEIRKMYNEVEEDIPIINKYKDKH